MTTDTTRLTPALVGRYRLERELRLLVRFDPRLHLSYGVNFAVRNGRFYFPSDNRQSDIWTMEVGRP